MDYREHRTVSYLYEDQHKKQTSRTPSPTTMRGSAGSRWAAEALPTEPSCPSRGHSSSTTQEDNGWSTHTSPLQQNPSLSPLDPLSACRAGEGSDMNAELACSTAANSGSGAEQDDPWGDWKPSVPTDQAGDLAYRQRLANTARLRRMSNSSTISPTISPHASTKSTPSALTASASDPAFKTDHPSPSILSEHTRQSSTSTQNSTQNPVTAASSPPHLPTTSTAASSSSHPSMAKSEDDPWASWAGTPQADEGGAAAFRSRQLMGVGDRTTALEVSKPSPSLSLPIKLTRPPPCIAQKKGKATPPAQPHAKRHPVPAVRKSQKDSVVVELPATTKKSLATTHSPSAKKQATAPPFPQAPLTPTKSSKPNSAPRQSGTSCPRSPNSADGSEGITVFPPGSLLAQIANPANGLPKILEEQLEKANSNIARILQAVEKTSDETPAPQKDDLLSGNVNQDTLASVKQGSTLALADELAGLSFDIGDNGASPHHPTSQIGSKSTNQISFMDELGGSIHKPLLGLGLRLSDDSVKTTVPCLIIDQDGGSDGGSPITPLQPLRALSFFSPPGTTEYPSVPKGMQSTAATIPIPIDRQTKLENAVKAFGYPPSISTRLLELLKTLPRKDQAVCLFNEAVLKEKIAMALEVIAAEDESEEEEEL